MTTLVAQLGARRHYAVPRALHSAGELGCLATDICADLPPWSWLNTILPMAMRSAGLKRLLGRKTNGIPANLIRNQPVFSLWPYVGKPAGENHPDYWARRNEAFCRSVPDRLIDANECVYAYNGAALEIFERAKAQGARTVVDQTAAPWRYNRRLLDDELKRWEGWETEPAEIDYSGNLTEREEQEWELADCVVCGSRFARDAYVETGGDAAKAMVLPYAGHISPPDVAVVEGRPSTRLNVLFVGSLQLRKGVQYFPEAAQRLKSRAIDFRLVGKSALGRNAETVLSKCCELVGQVARKDMAEQYAWADVFVLPTLSEGSANVVYEAMSHGLAVVTTANAGSVITHGFDGFIVPVRDSAALAEAIEQLADDAPLREQLGRNAAASIRASQLGEYSDGLMRAVTGRPGIEMDVKIVPGDPYP